ncbi:MAG TPA: D-aminoacyl-tRNA deacylase [Terriglobia bacterium]|nr:D-aminoacyl-tRNA deacylase [Terriglobia bacterium]
MRAVVQRVRSAEVRVDDQVIGRIGRGLLVLVGVGTGDTRDSAQALAEKIVHLRIFDDGAHRMNRSLLDAGGSVLCVSQFTLYGDCRKGRRPGYDRAAPPEIARPLYDAFVDSLRALLTGANAQVETGQFQAMMDVESINDGPVTLLLDSDRTF